MTTPLRAIPSTLALKSKPTVPLPAELYLPHIKSALSKRLVTQIFLYSFLFCYAGSVWTHQWQPISVDVVVDTLVKWAAGAVPLVVLRKVYLTSTRSAGGSPSKTFHNSWQKARTKNALALLVVSAMILGVVMTEESVFARSRKHPYYLNPRFLFLVASQIVIGVGYTVRDIMQDRFVVNFAKGSISFSNVLSITILCTLFATVTLPATFVAVIIFRLVLPIIYWTPFRFLARPFTAHFLRSSIFRLPFLPLTHLSLGWSAWKLGFNTLLLWELTTMLFVHYTSQPIKIDDSIVVISGVTYPTESEDNKFYVYHAYTALLSFFDAESSTAKKKRTAIFENQQYSPTLIKHIIREGLLWLGKDYRFFVSKGNPPPPKPASSSTPTPPVPPNTPLRAPVLKQEILKRQVFASTPKKSPLKNVVDNFASDGDFVKVLDEGAKHLPQVHLPELGELGLSDLPEVFRSRTATPTKAVAASPAEQATLSRKSESIKQMLSLTPLKNFPAFRSIQRWYTRERQDKLVKSWARDIDGDLGVIKLLTAVVCSSLTEDTYGMLARNDDNDVPKILEAFVKYLDAVETVQTELVAKLPSPPPQTPLSAEELEVSVEVEKALDVLAPLRDELKNALSQITRTFGRKLEAFVFPVRVGEVLESYVRVVME